MNTKRLIWLLPVIAIICGTIANYLFSSLISTSLGNVSQIDYPYLSTSQALVYDLTGIQESLKNAVSAADKEGLKQVALKAEAFQADLARLEKIPGLQAANAIKPLFEAYYGAATKSAEIMLGSREGDIAATAGLMQTAQQALTAKLQETRDQAKTSFEANIENSSHYSSRGLVANIVVAALILFISVGTSTYAVSNVLKQLGGEPEYAKSIVHSVASGNLEVNVTLKQKDQSSLLYAMKGMQEKFSTIIGEVSDSVASMRTGATEIASGNMNLSKRTEKQAASLEQTAATLDQLTSTVKQNAENAREADKLATNASNIASEGGKAVGAVVSTMNAINDSARKIVDIIAVIDGIAFQTNILALNAAVEAARAGEQGRGFAVVASEVRNLAQRSAAAAKEIKELIGDSVSKVQEGSRQVQAAGDTMQNIVTSVKLVNDIIAEISTASLEQSRGIVQVNSAISDLDGVTQENARLVEDAAKAAASLEDVAARVSQSISIFKLNSATRASSVAPTSNVSLLDSRRKSRQEKILALG